MLGAGGRLGPRKQGQFKVGMDAGITHNKFPRARRKPSHIDAQLVFTRCGLQRVRAIDAVEVVVFSWVEELVAVTVAPGIEVFPDFTTPLCEQCRAATTVGFPLSPQRGSQSQPDPPSEIDQHLRGFAEAEVASPASHVGS